MAGRENFHRETLAVSAGRPAHYPDAPLNEPVVFASAFGAGGELEYARYNHPNSRAFEETLGALEGGHALAFASGMAATAAVIDLVPNGGRVVVPRHSYLGTIALLHSAQNAGRLSVTEVDILDTAAVVAALPGAALAWLESPTNPALEVADLPTLLAAAHAAGVRSVVDNTFATPVLQRPLEWGADIVMHSATKSLAGHSDVVLGALVVRDEELHAELATRRKLLGGIAGPMELYLALRGLRTLSLRVERASANAAELVRRFGSHPALAEVRYPDFGSIVAFVFADADRAERFIAALELWRHATSLGGVESTLERRRRHPGESLSIPEGLVRLSVGIEHVDDLAVDLQRALDSV
ncbi:MAG TPA: PLP-dependent transferase [Microbacteriaceae bacterium]|nr:PLP-dependent transferase [Microbacteriaceae bacterium]